MVQLVDLALVDITTAPKWPPIIAPSKSKAAEKVQTAKKRVRRR
jgi:hypothetical protein